MNEAQKQRAVDLIDVTKTYRLDAEECAMQMAALLQELADAPEPEPFAVIHLDGYRVYVEFKQTITGTGKFEVYAAPPAPADVARWIDPNDKTQPQYLPHVGERVLFCHDGKTYYGKHTGGSFISFTHPGNTYPTWECHWTYPPKAIDAAMNEKGGA